MISIFTTLLIAYSINLFQYFGVGYYFNHEECQIIWCWVFSSKPWHRSWFCRQTMTNFIIKSSSAWHSTLIHMYLLAVYRLVAGEDGSSSGPLVAGRFFMPSWHSAILKWKISFTWPADDRGIQSMNLKSNPRVSCVCVLSRLVTTTWLLGGVP